MTPDSFTSSRGELGCDSACQESNALSYPLNPAEPDSQFLVKVTVTNQYGQSSQVTTLRTRSLPTTTCSVTTDISPSTGTSRNADEFSLTSLYLLIPIVLVIMISVMCNLIQCVMCRAYAKKERRRILSRSHDQFASVEMIVRDTMRRQQTDNVYSNNTDDVYISGSVVSVVDDFDTYTQESGFIYADAPARAYDFTVTHTL